MAVPTGFFFLHRIRSWAITAFQKQLSLRLLSFLQSVTYDEVSIEKSLNEDIRLGRKDVEMVMSRIGLSCEQMEFFSVGSDDLTRMFEEDEPSTEEVREAFCVFDEERDGFIDAVKLQRVMLRLGFREGMELDACREMIAVHDEDGDGRIDFREFVKLMERSFC